MTHFGFAVVLSVALLFGMLVCLEIGLRIGRRSAHRQPGSAYEGIGTIEAAVFALLGLLLGFAFAGGTSRLDARRELIVKETNAIGTAYLRLDLLPAGAQADMRRLFREYLDARLSVYDKLPDLQAAEQEMARATQLQQKIWTDAIAARGSDSTQDVARLLLPALNEMIDVTTERTIALHTHLPPLIFALLISIALLTGLLAGYGMSKRQNRSWLHLLVYAFVIAITIFVLLDLEYPRFGLIRLRDADKALVQLRNAIR